MMTRAIHLVLHLLSMIQPFGEVAKVKYLGHVIANDMTDDADMMRQRRQLWVTVSYMH